MYSNPPSAAEPGHEYTGRSLDHGRDLVSDTIRNVQTPASGAKRAQDVSGHELVGRGLLLTCSRVWRTRKDSSPVNIRQNATLPLKN